MQMKEEKGDDGFNEAKANATQHKATRAREERKLGIPLCFPHMSSPCELCDLVGYGD
jgi:hypothetical protein